MSVYKSLTTSDVICTPFKANKSFSFLGSDFTSPNIGIDRFIGTNITSSFISGSNPTGQIASYNKQIIYDSIKQLYYSNFVRGEDGSTVLTSSVLPDGVRVGQGGIQPMYENRCLLLVIYLSYSLATCVNLTKFAVFLKKVGY